MWMEKHEKKIDVHLLTSLSEDIIKKARSKITKNKANLYEKTDVSKRSERDISDIHIIMTETTGSKKKMSAKIVTEAVVILY